MLKALLLYWRNMLFCLGRGFLGQHTVSAALFWIMGCVLYEIPAGPVWPLKKKRKEGDS